MLFFVPSMASAKTEKMHLKLLTRNLQLIQDSNGKASGQLHLVVSGGSPSRLTAELVDLALTDTGKTVLKAGLTDYSLLNQLKISPAFYHYSPSTKPQLFIFDLQSSSSELKEVRFGGARVSATADKAASISMNAGLVTSVALIPHGMAFDLEEKKIERLKIESFELVQAKVTTLADSVIPDIPGLINHGPVSARLKVENPNELPLFESARVAWDADDMRIGETSLTQKMLMGNQKTTLISNSVQVLSGHIAPIDFSPSQGVLKVTVEAQSGLGNSDLPPQKLVASALIFPWKEWVLNLGLVSLLLWLALRKRGSKKNKQPSLAKLFVIYVYKEAKKRLQLFHAKS